MKILSWTKKELNRIFKIGDIIYVKNNKDNLFSLKQVTESKRWDCSYWILTQEEFLQCLVDLVLN